VLLPEELSWLVAQRHKPLALVQALSTIVESAGLHPMIKHAMDGQLTLYTYEFGACNRTYNTAIPTAYTRCGGAARLRCVRARCVCVCERERVCVYVLRPGVPRGCDVCPHLACLLPCAPTQQLASRHTHTHTHTLHTHCTHTPRRRHTSRFLLCYILVGLPLLLWPMAGWASPVLAVVIAFLLLGVENIAAYIEEPFYVSCSCAAAAAAGARRAAHVADAVPLLGDRQALQRGWRVWHPAPRPQQLAPLPPKSRHTQTPHAPRARNARSRARSQAIAFDSFAGAVQRDVLTIVAMWAGSSADRTGLTDPLNPAAAEGGRATNAPVVAGVTSPLLPQLACGPPGAAAPSDGAATGEGPDGDGDDDDDGDDCEFVDGGSVDDGDDGSATVAGGGGGSSSGSSSSSSPDPLGASKAAAAAAAAKVSAEIQHQRGAGAAGSAGSGSSSGSSSAAMHRVSSTDDVRPPPRHGGGSAARHRLALPAHLGSSVLGAACGGGSASASEQQQRDQVVHHPTPPAANSSSTGSPRHSSLQRGHHHQQQQQQQQQQGGVQRTAAAPGDCRVTIVP
jgi:hypothetical protein